MRVIHHYRQHEWKLAAERAQGIAEQIPFVLPVVVDDTQEYAASVPECFLAAQWTRLMDGESHGDFETRVASIVDEHRQREGLAA